MKKLLLATTIALVGCAQGPQVRQARSLLPPEPPSDLSVGDSLMALAKPELLPTLLQNQQNNYVNDLNRWNLQQPYPNNQMWVPQTPPIPSPYHSYQFGTNLPINCVALGGMTTCN